jgi:squalene-hopene/tetraprenyl-beta-curcumene cyclase
LQKRIERSSRRAFGFLLSNQRKDGAFIPLWFGNEHGHDDQNPVYGTAQVLIGLNELRDSSLNVPAGLAERAAQFLAEVQHENGGWGGDKNLAETIEETALGLEAMTGCEGQGDVRERALARLLQLIDEKRYEHASPIGFYFARLWYYERLYPLIFPVSALGAALSKDG